MATTVPSRFAVLSLDDDDNKPKRTQKVNSTVKTAQKNKGSEKQKQPVKKDEKKKPNKSNKKKKPGNENQQWEQWKQKDTENVEEVYEQDLHQAILMSKLAYDVQLENAKKSDKDTEQAKKGNSKKGKRATMSLEEFNNLGVNGSQSSTAKTVVKEEKSGETNVEYFERIEKETAQEIIKSKEKDTVKARLNQLDETITMAQLKQKVEKRDNVISKFKDEVEALKKELSEVKNRNKKLCNMLGQGEMKEKAAIIAEFVKLQEVRDDLLSEVSSLHAQLEQERSKTRASSTDAKSTKQSNKKRAATESA